MTGCRDSSSHVRANGPSRRSYLPFLKHFMKSRIDDGVLPCAQMEQTHTDYVIHLDQAVIRRDVEGYLILLRLP